MMLHKTKAIVLRTVKYGETSMVVTCFTEQFGLQSYMVNGIRQISKKGASRSVYFQPAAVLDLVVYHNEIKKLQRIKEFKWAHLYQHVFSDVFINAVSVYIIELVNKTLKEPEHNPELFHFLEDVLLHLDSSGRLITANLPLFFSLHLPVFFGFRISDNFSETNFILDLQEGMFTSEGPKHAYYIEGKMAEIVSHILKAMTPADLGELKLNQDTRRQLLTVMETYYALHISDFGSMKTLPVLREISEA
jgi:DNA repair protein RecO (recombination protein O)